MSAAASDVILIALVVALGMLLAAWGFARSLRRLRRRVRHVVHRLRYPAARRYEDFYRLVEQAPVVQGEDTSPGKRAESYMQVAALVRPGEWTTYGDISIAVRGDSGAARAVGRAAATLDDFPHPHRVLKEGGIIPAGWRLRVSGVRAPEVCRQRLEAEGVRFEQTTGRARAEYHVRSDVLAKRLNGRAPKAPPRSRPRDLLPKAQVKVETEHQPELNGAPSPASATIPPRASI